MTTVVLRAPPGATGPVQAPGGPYQPAADGSVVVDASLVPTLLRSGYAYFFSDTGSVTVSAPITAELVSVIAAALPVSGTPMTLATQPGYPRKLQVRCVQSGAVAALVVNLVGVDGRGNTVTESVSVAGASSATFPTVNAYAKVTSVTPVGTVTNVTTIGVGVGTALALPLPPVFYDLLVYKANVDLTDEAVGTLDATAGTIVPNTVPNATHNYTFWYGFSRASQ